ncbi:C1 family peptidase [Acetobacter aceti]|uniref:Peptidase C39-like domain-containing protein n=1 Tax=Acetobacter aceti TaxID=435 RepID=A0A6S6PGB2_ACEAC|nr:hypothetical protein [Acetobacter aceti]BCI68047.1 hypothetical protein AAJCM20276_26710 [Acetobacter aceti]
MTRRLGKLAPRHDPRTFRMSAPLARALPVIPPSADWAPDVSWPMWCNDRYGCCTQVSVASAIRTWTGAAQAPILLTDDEVLENYSAVTSPPFDPDQPATDRGAVELDVLNHWIRYGLAMPGSQPGRSYLTAYGAIDPRNRQSVQRAIAFLGGAYIGLSLPQWCCDTDDDWTYDPQRDNSIAGGHAVWLHGYDADWLYLNTWGGPRRMSYEFLAQFCDEAYGLVARQHWSDIHGVSPKGEALDALVTEMRAVADA